MAQQTDQHDHRSLYPPIEPYDTGFLKVTDVHTLYYEQSGNAGGNPVLFVHGGPGGGTSPNDRCFFDPAVYRIILFDQRGSGKSTPAAELKENTTWSLVEDIETLRKQLGVDKWVVFGGSWGSTLALSYAETHPSRVKALVLRGVFTLRRKELEWFYEGKGANMLFPDYWEDYINFIPEVERGAVMDAYYRRLTSESEETRIEAAKRWSTWEMATSHLYINQEKVKKAEKEAVWAQQFARIECHYFVNGGFFKSPSQLIDNVDKIRHIPATIVQGRYDIVCPMDTAWQLHKIRQFCGRGGLHRVQIQLDTPSDYENFSLSVLTTGLLRNKLENLVTAGKFDGEKAKERPTEMARGRISHHSRRWAQCSGTCHEIKIT